MDGKLAINTEGVPCLAQDQTKKVIKRCFLILFYLYLLHHKNVKFTERRKDSEDMEAHGYAANDSSGTLYPFSFTRRFIPNPQSLTTNQQMSNEQSLICNS